MKLPENVEKELKLFAEQSETDPDKIIKEYIKEFEDPWIQGDGWIDDDDRHNFLLTEFKKNYVMRPKAIEFVIVPIGNTSIKRARVSKEPQCSMYALTKSEEDDGTVFRRIMLRGASVTKKLKNLNWLCKYTDVKFGYFKGEDGVMGDLIADDRTKFGDPDKTNMTYMKLIEKLKVKRTNMKDALKNLSKVDKKGYPIATDLRVIRGMIKSKVDNVEDPDNEVCNYKIVDRSCGTEPIVTPDGKEVYPGITAWMPHNMMKHDVDAMIDVIGVLKEQKVKDPDDADKYIGTGLVSMNGIFTVGIHERPREE